MQIGKAKSLIFNISYISWDKTLNSTSFVVKTYLVSKGMVALLVNKKASLKSTHFTLFRGLPIQYFFLLSMAINQTIELD